MTWFETRMSSQYPVHTHTHTHTQMESHTHRNDTIRAAGSALSEQGAGVVCVCFKHVCPCTIHAGRVGTPRGAYRNAAAVP